MHRYITLPLRPFVSSPAMSSPAISAPPSQHLTKLWNLASYFLWPPGKLATGQFFTARWEFSHRINIIIQDDCIATHRQLELFSKHRVQRCTRWANKWTNSFIHSFIHSVITIITITIRAKVIWRHHWELAFRPPNFPFPRGDRCPV